MTKTKATNIAAKIFNKQLTKKEVRLGTIIAVRTGNAEVINLSRQLKIGYMKASKLSKLLYRAGVIVDSTFKGTTILLKKEDTAINAALRQFKKESQ